MNRGSLARLNGPVQRWKARQADGAPQVALAFERREASGIEADAVSHRGLTRDVPQAGQGLLLRGRVPAADRPGGRLERPARRDGRATSDRRGRREAVSARYWCPRSSWEEAAQGDPQLTRGRRRRRSASTASRLRSGSPYSSARRRGAISGECAPLAARRDVVPPGGSRVRSVHGSAAYQSPGDGAVAGDELRMGRPNRPPALPRNRCPTTAHVAETWYRSRISAGAGRRPRAPSASLPSGMRGRTRLRRRGSPGASCRSPSSTADPGGQDLQPCAQCLFCSGPSPAIASAFVDSPKVSNALSSRSSPSGRRADQLTREAVADTSSDDRFRAPASTRSAEGRSRRDEGHPVAGTARHERIARPQHRGPSWRWPADRSAGRRFPPPSSFDDDMDRADEGTSGLNNRPIQARRFAGPCGVDHVGAIRRRTTDNGAAPREWGDLAPCGGWRT
jgi:hypothetical protein